MTRKDTIVIAVLINMGLLALLFATAVVIDEPSAQNGPVRTVTEPSLATASPIKKEAKPLAVIEEPTAKPTLEPLFSHVYTAAKQEPAVSSPLAVSSSKEMLSSEKITPPSDAIVVTVQEGDRLEKMARKYGTSVTAIKNVNHLSTEKIQVGQTLYIPKEKEIARVVDSAPAKQEETSEFYVIKSGDNPWTIAKQCNVRYQDLLRLNHLDESKAKSLRPGDRIRVR